jgi:hypothetical protein
VADSVSDAVKSAYSKLKHLVTAKFGGNESAELVLSEHASDAETWQAPLNKALAVSGASADPAVIDAAQALMALLDPVGSAAGAYRVDLRGRSRVRRWQRYATGPAR